MYLSLLHVNVGNRPGRQWLGNLYRIHQRLWMAFPDKESCQADPFFLETWDGPAIAEPKPKRKDAGFLFRVEHDGSPRILVQSTKPPNWEYAFQNAPHLLTSNPKVLEFDPSPRSDQAYRFRLLANVVTRKSVIHCNGKMRATHAGLTIHRKRRTEILVHPEPIPEERLDTVAREQLLLARWNPWREWLGHIGSQKGFRVVDESNSPLLMQVLHVSVRNPGKDHGGSNKPIDRRFNAGLFEGLLVCTDPDQLHDAVVNGVGPAKAFGFGLLSLAPAR